MATIKKPVRKAQNGRNFGLPSSSDSDYNYNEDSSRVKVNSRVKDNTDNSDNSRMKDKSDNSTVNRTKDNSKTKDSRKNKVKYKIAKGATVNFNTAPSAKKGISVKKSAPKMKMGGSLKPVSSDKVGLKKLPTAVRNKMGYQKNGGMMKKAKSGTSLGMKSVKSGYDNNPGVTRADIITAAKGKAKSGASMKAGGKMKKCRGGCK